MNTDEKSLILKAQKAFEEQSSIVKYSTNPVVKAVLGISPYTGPIASLLGDWAQKRQEIRLRKFLIELAKELDQAQEIISEHIDIEFLHTDDFAVILETILTEAASTANEEKLRLLRDFIRFSFLKNRPDTTWQELFLKYIRQLSGIHLVILQLYYKIQGNLPSSDRLGSVEIENQVPVAVSQISKHLMSVDKNLIRIACTDLANLGLLVDWRHLNDQSGKFQENYSLTDNGAFFMRYLHGSWLYHPSKPTAI